MTVLFQTLHVWVSIVILDGGRGEMHVGDVLWCIPVREPRSVSTFNTFTFFDAVII